MKCITIKDSYDIWLPTKQKMLCIDACLENYQVNQVPMVLNRSWTSIYIEWWLHNIGYYLTKPFCKNDFINKLNLRFKDVDLEEHF